jgi:FkbH-like protein
MAPTQLDPQKPLIAYGMDSVMAIELRNGIEANLGVTLPVASLYEDLGVSRLAMQVLDRLATTPDVERVPLVRAREGATSHPLSFEQEQLWLLHQLLADSNLAYNISAAVHLEGAIDVETLERSINEIVTRHQSLHTTFATADGRPVQIIGPPVAVAIPVIELQETSKPDRQDRIQQVAVQEAQRPFDMDRCPLVRGCLLRLDESEHVLIVTMPHIVSDGWSFGVFLRELCALNTAFSAGESSPLAELPIQYPDFVHWQRQRWARQEEALEIALAYWKQHLDGAPRLLDLPTDRPRPSVRSFRGATERFTLSGSLTEALETLSREEGVTLFMTLLAAFEALLYRYTGQEDLVVGTPMAGRNRSEVEGLIGLFVKTLVMRTDLSGDPTFIELLGRVRKVALGAYAHQDVPLSKITGAVPQELDLSYPPVYQVAFLLQSFLMPSLHLRDLAATPLDVDTGTIDIDLRLTMREERNGLAGSLAYNADLFDADTAGHLAGFLRGILETCVQCPETKLSQLELPGELEARIERARARERRQTIAVASTFTAEPVEDSLAFWMQTLDVPFRIDFAPYNQVFQQLLDPAGLFSRNQHGVNVVLARFQDWQRDAGDGDAEAARWVDVRARIEQSVLDFCRALESAAGRSTTSHLVLLCPGSPDGMDGPDRAAFLKQMEEIVVAETQNLGGVYVATPSDVHAVYPVATCHDPQRDRLGHVPFTPACFAAFGTMIARKMHAIQNPPYKVIVLDCDQTLWKGVCGEDGALGVEIDDPRKFLQQFVASQVDAGMLVCLCSKNDERDVIEVFERRSEEMALTRDHLVSWRINWRPKSENVRSLADELELGLDAFIFIDDDPVECAEVRSRCPEVLTLLLPREADDIPRFLEHVWAFDHLRLTEEDRRRTSLYRQNAVRRRFREESLTFEDFLAGLELEIQISGMSPRQVARVSQLTRRTNQFNCTTIRRSESEIRECCASAGLECRVVEVRDRFGDYGLVGVMIFGPGTDAIEVDTFLLSCRALGRGVEHRMIAELGKIAGARGLGYVDLPFVPGPRNRPALDFANGVGQEFRQPAGDGDGWLFRLPVEYARTVAYDPSGADTRSLDSSNELSELAPAGERTASGMRATSLVQNRIARELCSVERILRAVESGRHRVRPEVEGVVVPPRTPTEKTLVDLWKETLGVDGVGIHDNFFRLGGHSLQGTLLISRINRTFQVELSLLNLVESPTVADLARRVKLHQIEQVDAVEIAEALKELEGLSDEEVSALLAGEVQ